MRLSEDLRSRAVPDSNSCVVVIDDDQEFRESLGRLLRSVGLDPGCFRRLPTLWDPTGPIALPVWSSM